MRARSLRMDERNHVEKPLLAQLRGLGWEIIDLTEAKQNPGDTFRESFTEVCHAAGAARTTQGHQPVAGGRFRSKRW